MPLQHPYLLSAIGISTALLLAAACDEATGVPGEEDKDGVNEVPSPGQEPAGTGVGGLGGEGGGSGGGSGVPCLMDTDCNDNNLCTSEYCGSGDECVFGPTDTDGDMCTDDVCDPATGDYTFVPVAVTDNNVCTIDSCDTFTGVSNVANLPIYVEDFSSNTGWTLPNQWYIGSAAPSSGGLNGGNDPALDNTTTDDDGILGTGLGALLTQNAASFAISPAIDINGVVAGEFVTLSFFRWLNADIPGETNMTVEVYDQASDSWTLLWSNPVEIIDSPPRGMGWIEVRYDITAAATAAQGTGQPLYLAFGYSKGAAVPSVGGWNIDDLRISRSLVQADGDICTTDGCTDNAGAPAFSSVPLTMPDDGDDCTTDPVCVANAGPLYASTGAPGCP